MLDATVTAVIRLYEQGVSVKEIARRLNIGNQKSMQILVTAGLVETDESRLQKQGKSVDEICELLGKSRKAVLPRLPYSKGQYNAEYPTINALRIRKCRDKEADA